MNQLKPKFDYTIEFEQESIMLVDLTPEQQKAYFEQKKRKKNELRKNNK